LTSGAHFSSRNESSTKRLEGLRQTHAAAMAAPMEASFYTKDFLDKGTEIFARAKQSASGDPQVLRRVARAELPVLYVKCSPGPEFVGEEYSAVVAQFERVARDFKVAYLQEGATHFEAKLAGWKARIPKPSSTGLKRATN
jgi:hypothetical protein